MILEYEDFRITEHFSIKEFHCKDGVRVPYGYVHNCIYIASILELVRKVLGVPIIINSAYRTVDHNIKIGGAKRSNHLQAMAVDICQRKFDNRTFYNLLKELIELGIIPDGEFIYYKTFVHYAPHIRGNYYPTYNGKYWINPQEKRAELQDVRIKYVK